MVKKEVVWPCWKVCLCTLVNDKFLEEVEEVDL